MHLRPSRIYFSQDSISNRFGRSTEHAGVMIGETLDDILTGECSIYDIDPIEVETQNGVYRTADNRRLWIFKKLEELGECTTIPICLISAIDSSAKCETEKTIRVRGTQGGTFGEHGVRQLVGEGTQLYMSPIPSRPIRTVTAIRKDCDTVSVAFRCPHDKNTK